MRLAKGGAWRQEARRCQAQAQARRAACADACAKAHSALGPQGRGAATSAQGRDDDARCAAAREQSRGAAACNEA